MNLTLGTIDLQDATLAAELHALQLIAYAQEAQLLDVAHFPPLMRSLDDLQQSAEIYIGAYLGKQLVGAIGTESSAGSDCLCITSLVVSPKFQRRGIATQLLASIIASHLDKPLQVETAGANYPALSLYQRYGFIEARRWCDKKVAIELIELTRPPESATPL